MPCQDTYEGDEDCDYQYRVNTLTQDLCFLCGQLIDAGLFEKYASKRIIDWQKKHHESDRDRVLRKMNDRLHKFPNLSARSLADVFIVDAMQVHPVSTFHEKWFFEMATIAKSTFDLPYSHNKVTIP
jgi:hypothetical protein